MRRLDGGWKLKLLGMLRAVLPAALALRSAHGQPFSPDTAELVPGAGSSFAPEQVADSRAPLILGDINIIHVTDVHSYISGHRHGESTVSTGYGDQWRRVVTATQDADYADLLSFIEHMKQRAVEEQRDLWVVNSGDVLDGTGISNLSPVNGANLLPLLQQMPFDAVAIGNHELYSSRTVGHMASSGFIDHWGSAYVTSNILSAAPSALAAGKSVGDPLGAPYTVLRGTFGRSILVLGFLYNMDDHCDNVEVVHADVSVRQPWFAEAMAAAADVDAVVVLSHMDLQASELAVIRGAVRRSLGLDKPLCAAPSPNTDSLRPPTAIHRISGIKSGGVWRWVRAVPSWRVTPTTAASMSTMGARLPSSLATTSTPSAGCPTLYHRLARRHRCGTSGG